MRILRCTMYADGHGLDPVASTVMRETDLRLPFDLAVEELSAVRPGTFVVADRFEMAGEPSIEEATAAARARFEAQREQERNQVILYLWTLGHLRHLNPGGIIQTTEPTPLSVDQIVHALRNVAVAPQYQGQHVRLFVADMTRIDLASGKVTVHRAEDAA